MIAELKKLPLYHRPQFSLAALLLGMSALCLWLGGQTNRADVQRKALLLIERLHGVVAFQDRLRANTSPAVPKPTPASVGQTARGPASEEHFRSIAEVNISFNPFVIGAKPELRADDDDLRVICATRTVRRLALNGTAITDEGLECLSRLTDVESLQLRNPITPDGLEASMLLRRLGHGYEDSTLVSVAGYEYGAAAKPYGESFPPAMWLARDSMWRFAGPLVTDNGLRHLAVLQSLRELYLDGTAVTDAGMKRLVRLSNLEHLSLAETAVSDAGLAMVCRLPKLKTLDLRGAKITDAGLKCLYGAGSAMTVLLGDTEVTPKAVEHYAVACLRAKRVAPKVNLESRYPDVAARKARDRLRAQTSSDGGDFHGIESLTALERGRAYVAWERVKRNELRYFMQIADQPKANYAYSDQRYLAVRALETIRNPEAAEVLIRHLDWEYLDGEVGASELDTYPCASALQTMGASIVPDLLNWFRGLHARETASSRSKRIELAAAVLREIYDIDGGAAEAMAVVNRFIDRVAPEQRGDLKRIVKLIQDNSKR
jgi:hypothetical protein